MRYFTNQSNERTCSVLYATLENSIHSAIYAASSLNTACFIIKLNIIKINKKNYKTGVNGVAHFAELVHTYRSAIKIIVLSSCLKKDCTVLRSLH